MVRKFAAWLSTIDSRTEVPPRRLLPDRQRRKTPHIYSGREIELLMAEAARLPSSLGLRPITYKTLIGLLASTGLRPQEALALNRADVDLETGNPDTNPTSSTFGQINGGRGSAANASRLGQAALKFSF